MSIFEKAESDSYLVRVAVPLVVVETGLEVGEAEKLEEAARVECMVVAVVGRVWAGVTEER